VTAVALLSDLRCQYACGEQIVVDGIPREVTSALVRTAFGRTHAGQVVDGRVRFGALPAGTHAVELYGSDQGLLAEEIVGVREQRGEDPVMGFATSFDPTSVPATLAWLARLRCTVVQIYDWMASYSEPLGPAGVYRDGLGREIDREALEQLITGIRELGAVAQAYAPVAAADPGTHPESRLLRSDGAPQALGDLLDIMDPGDPAWQRHWLAVYGAAADALGFDGFHLDTYGYPRAPLSVGGEPVAIEAAYESFIRAVRAGRPRDVISFNQVNGVPSGIAPPAAPGFRYVEVWPPNDRWRHLEALMARSAGLAPRQGDTLAIYPPVWEGDREQGLRTVVLTEAITTALGIGALIWGDAAGALRHPYYVDHERLTEAEAETAVAWRRFGLRCRDLFRFGQDTSWYELDDENAALTVAAAVPARPEPVGGALFTRVVRDADTIVVSLIDLSGSRDGSWSQGTAPGVCDVAGVTALVEQPERWCASVAALGRDGGRFAPVELAVGSHREGRAVTCEVPIVDGWSVLRLENGKP
jgi:dextranase